MKHYAFFQMTIIVDKGRVQKSVLSKSGRVVECVQQKMTNDDDEVGSRREKGITVL